LTEDLSSFVLNANVTDGVSPIPYVGALNARPLIDAFLSINGFTAGAFSSLSPQAEARSRIAKRLEILALKKAGMVVRKLMKDITK
jgi:hypothetical protein